jgi:transcriptional antiterminator NusG
VNDESDNATDQALDPSAPVPPAGPANGAAAETAASPEGATVEAAAPASNVSAAGTVPTIVAPSPPVRIPPVRRSAGENAPPPNPEERHWFILKVQSNREESIKDALQRRVAIEGLEAYFGDVIVPVEMVSEFKNGKKRIVKRKLYPGYIVVHMEINDETWHLVRSTPGIGDFVGAAGKPTPMVQRDVDAILKKKEEKTEAQPKVEIRFSPGDRVKIKGGTFETFEGSDETIDMANGRVTVMINIFGRSTPVELDYWEIEGI